jgi:hypothetical protein
MPDGRGANLPPEHGHGEVGCWRLEISPRASAQRDCFLTVIHAGLAEEKAPGDKVRFDVQKNEAGVTLGIFGAGGPPATTIRFAVAGAVTAEIDVAGRRARYAASAPSRIAAARRS